MLPRLEAEKEGEMKGISGEDEHWEYLREKMENSKISKYDDWGEVIFKKENLFLYEEAEKVEKEWGYPMEELYEGDLIEIVEKYKGVEADSAKWNKEKECIEYRYEVA